MRYAKLSLILAALSILAACSSTTLRDVWQSPEFHKDQLKQVLVIGLSDNTTHRLVFERDLSKTLKDYGVKATPSFEVFGSEQLPTKDMVLKFVDYEGIDYVLVTYVDKVEKSERYVPPTVSASVGVSPRYYPYPYYPSFGSMWGPGGAAIVTSPGYVKKTQNTVLVTSIYDAKSKEMVWSASTATFQEKSVSKISHEVAEVIWNSIAE